MIIIFSIKMLTFAFCETSSSLLASVKLAAVKFAARRCEARRHEDFRCCGIKLIRLILAEMDGVEEIWVNFLIFFQNRIPYFYHQNTTVEKLN